MIVTFPSRVISLREVMSNPGVIVLASVRNAGANIKRLDIEDNIGESIHIHLNSFRFDFSVDIFFLFRINS